MLSDKAPNQPTSPNPRPHDHVSPISRFPRTGSTAANRDRRPARGELATAVSTHPHLGLPSGKLPMHLLHRLNGTAFGSIPVRLVAQVSFEDGFQNEFRCRLGHSISNGWYPRGLSSSRLRYRHPPYWLGSIALPLQCLLQLLEPPFLAILLDVLEGLPIDSGCAFLRLRPLERLRQGRLELREGEGVGCQRLALVLKEPIELRQRGVKCRWLIHGWPLGSPAASTGRGGARRDKHSRPPPSPPLAERGRSVVGVLPLYATSPMMGYAQVLQSRRGAHRH